MPNTLLTPSVIATAALATLYENAVMAGLVHRDYEPDFNGKVGDTITVRKPSVFTANTFNRATGITVQNITETGVPVTLDTLLDVSIAVTDEEMSLKIDDFAVQVLNPAMEAINQGIDNRLVTTLTGTGVTASVAVASAPALVDAATALTAAKVPLSDRQAVHSSTQAGALLKDPLFHQAQERGDTEGLTEATIGRKFGMDNYIDQHVDAVSGVAGVAFHRTACALVTRTLALPTGGVQAASKAYKGLALRVMYGYDQTHKQQILSIDTLIGVKLLDANRAVKLT